MKNRLTNIVRKHTDNVLSSVFEIIYCSYRRGWEDAERYWAGLFEESLRLKHPLVADHKAKEAAATEYVSDLKKKIDGNS